MATNLGQAIVAGIGAALALPGLYFGVLTLASGWRAPTRPCGSCATVQHQLARSDGSANTS